ncbi:MAG: hypothetical protein SGILL_007113 [Bacillariaceae sp.]
MGKRMTVDAAEEQAVKKHKAEVEKLNEALEKELNEIRAKLSPRAAFESRLAALEASNRGGWYVSNWGDPTNEPGKFKYSLYAEHHFEVESERIEDKNMYKLTAEFRDRWGNCSEQSEGDMSAVCQDHDVYTLDIYFTAHENQGNGDDEKKPST